MREKRNDGWDNRGGEQGMDGFAEGLLIVRPVGEEHTSQGDDTDKTTGVGITQKVYDEWCSSKLLLQQNLCDITEDEVVAIYHARYWLAGKCDALPWPASVAHFCACVNHGTKNAAKLLQRAIGVRGDGYIGQATLLAIRGTNPAVLLDQLLRNRRDSLLGHLLLDEREQLLHAAHR